MSTEISTIELARRLRAHALRMTHRARASHVGSCLSIADLLAVLYSTVLRVRPDSPRWPERDRFILSKGHAAAIAYAVLAERGFFPLGWLDKYCEDGSPLAGHLTHYGVPGVEASTGSLGHGLSLGCGIALAGRYDQMDYRVFVILSDGECDEGSTWEAAMFAGHHKLGSLTAIIDYNGLQSLGRVKDVIDLEPFADKWRDFGWQTLEIDGHDHGAISDALEVRPSGGRPHAIIAHTIKGKGVSFMENEFVWHYKSVNDDQLTAALRELGAFE